MKAYLREERYDREVVLETFLSNQYTLLSLLDNSKAYNLNAVKIPISVSRWITISLGDTFEFVIMHNERHIVQAQSRLCVS